tara:strand:+ start:762 stop:1268 length:507 start_codon:yes stop_codon:yes gene_type:complete
MRIKSRLNPVGGFQDLWNEFKRPTPYRWPILGASLLSTFVLMFWVTQEQVIGPPARPQVSLISTFAEGRSEAEIIASNIENQRLKEQWKARRAEREAEIQDMYRTLGRATGIDVDAMERQIAEERAREEAERLRMLAQAGVPTDAQAETEAGTAIDAPIDPPIDLEAE